MFDITFNIIILPSGIKYWNSEQNFSRIYTRMVAKPEDKTNFDFIWSEKDKREFLQTYD